MPSNQHNIPSHFAYYFGHFSFQLQINAQIPYLLLDTGVPTEGSRLYPIENVPLAVFGVPDVAGRDPHVLCARREDFLQEGLHQVSKTYMKHQQIKSNLNQN